MIWGSARRLLYNVYIEGPCIVIMLFFTLYKIFDHLREEEGFSVTFRRVPIYLFDTPGVQSIEQLAGAIRSTRQELGHVVFASQHGLRRSSVGLALGCLLRVGPKAASMSETKVQVAAGGSFLTPTAASSRLLGQDEAGRRVGTTDSALDIGRGQHKGIMNLIRILPLGQVVKEEVDRVLDWSGSFYNIRDSVLASMEAMETERTSKNHKHNLMVPVQRLHTYAYLIVFHAYLRALKKVWVTGYNFQPFT